MKCPECGHKLTKKNYDPEFEWYECPGCEGCFTDDEIVKEDSGKPKLVAKGKKRRTELQEDEDRLEDMTKEIASKPVKAKGADTKHHRDELTTGQIVPIWGDEIQAIYEELGSSLDEVNAQDKALIIWREIYIHAGATAREDEFKIKLCKEHAA